MATIKYKDENGEWQEIAVGGGGGSITLDSEMSDTSENAVQNNVIKKYVDNAVAQGGGGGAKVYIIPEGVMKATKESPHILTDDEISDITDLLTNMNNAVIKLVDGYENIMSQYARGAFVGEMGALMADFTYIKVEGVVSNDNSIAYAMVIHTEIIITNQNGGVWSGWSEGKYTRSLF